jgi:hypothetical protein
MDAMTHIVETIGRATAPKTREQLRREINARYYAKVREDRRWRWRLQRLEAMRALFVGQAEGGTHAHH